MGLSIMGAPAVGTPKTATPLITTEKIEVVKKDFTAFKLDFINKHKSKYFKIDNHPTLNEIYFSIDKNNLIKNENTSLILKIGLAFKVWNYIFNASAVTVLFTLPVHQKTLQVKSNRDIYKYL